MFGGFAPRVLLSVFRSVAVFAVIATLVTGIGTGVRLLAGTIVAIGGNSNPTSAGMIQELGGNPLPPGMVNPTGLPLGVAGQGYLDPANPASPYHGYTFEPVSWPSQIPFTTNWDGSSGYEQSQRAGLANLQALVNPALETGDPVAVVGYSSGANVVVREMRYLKSIGAPDADRLSFTLIASMNRPNGGLAARFPGLFVPFVNVKFDGTTPADTPYKITDVSWQYDPVSDFPNYPLNVLADLNALVGFFTQHGNYYPADMKGPRVVPDYTDPASNITYVTLAAPRLPLLVPLRMLGVPKQLLDLVEPALKVLVDMGYDRSIKAGVPTPASLSPTPQRLLALPGQLLNAVGVGIQHALNPSWDRPPTSAPAVPATKTAAAVVSTGKTVAEQANAPKLEQESTGLENDGPATVEPAHPTAEPAHPTDDADVASSEAAPRAATARADDDTAPSGTGGHRSGRPSRTTLEAVKPQPVTGKPGTAAEADPHEPSTPAKVDDHSEESASDKAAA
ncbi:PE-PPE domain-containing protein [Mycolicibacterium cosmeticum]|uniref:PE-PPE domain-containing protein n=1 Tax=Mycolicibacterium cosmeticum TaxID=258533 RepID=UPI003204836F